MAALRADEGNTKVFGILCLVELIAALVAVCAWAAFPRRPDVFNNGILVDQQRTLSLLDRFSYSWNSMVLQIARERQMKLSDIPAPEYRIRSITLQKNFEAVCGSGRFWRQLVRAHFWIFVAQWMLTFVSSVLSLLPQLVLLKFLQRIENRGDSGEFDQYLLLWALALLISKLLQVGVDSWIGWITNSRLTMPVLSLLRSLVFSKAMKQYDLATASHGDGADAKDGTNSAEETEACRTGEAEASETVGD